MADITWDVCPKVDASLRTRGLRQPSGLTALGCQGSVRGRLTPPGQFEGPAQGSYKVPLRWRGGRLSAPFYCRLRRHITHAPPKGETTHYILRVASAPSSTAVTDSLDFQVADAPLQIQFASAKCVRCAPKGATTTLSPARAVKLKNPPAPRPVHLKNLFPQPFYTTRRVSGAPSA